MEVSQTAFVSFLKMRTDSRKVVSQNETYKKENKTTSTKESTGTSTKERQPATELPAVAIKQTQTVNTLNQQESEIVTKALQSIKSRQAVGGLCQEAKPLPLVPCVKSVSVTGPALSGNTVQVAKGNTNTGTTKRPSWMLTDSERQDFKSKGYTDNHGVDPV